MAFSYPHPSYDKPRERELDEAARRIRRWMASGSHVASRVELAQDLELLLSRLEANTSLTKRLHRRTQAAEAGLRDTVSSCRREGVSIGRRLANSLLSALETCFEQMVAKMTEADALIYRQSRWIDDLQSDKWVNCVFCGYRYLPRDASPTNPLALLSAHIAQCERHPLHQAREALLELYGWHHELQRFANHMPDGGAAMQESIDRARQVLAELDPAGTAVTPEPTPTEGTPS